MRGAVLLLGTVALAGCAAAEVKSANGPAFPAPPVGSNEIFREPTGAAPGRELIVADLNLPPNAVGEAHYHPWEEYLYVIGGSAVIEIDGMEEREIFAGGSFVIPARAVHTPKAGALGIRAIVIRVHNESDPVAVPAGER